MRRVLLIAAVVAIVAASCFEQVMADEMPPLYVEMWIPFVSK